MCVCKGSHKTVFLKWPGHSSLVATFFWQFFSLELFKKLFFLSGHALTLPPPSGRATNKKNNIRGFPYYIEWVNTQYIASNLDFCRSAILVAIYAKFVIVDNNHHLEKPHKNSGPATKAVPPPPPRA